MTAGDDGVGLLQRQRKACAVDAEKNVATAHLLIVPHHDIGHEARHVRRDFNDIGAEVGVGDPDRTASQIALIINGAYVTGLIAQPTDLRGDLVDAAVKLLV